MKPETLKLLTFICPPLAVTFKSGNFRNANVFLSILLTMFFWIPGVIYAYMFCFVLESKTSKSTSSTTVSPFAQSDNSEHNRTILILYNPTPVHPKANDIIFYPTTLTSVVVHIPTENPQIDYFEYYENKQQHRNNKNINTEQVVKI